MRVPRNRYQKTEVSSHRLGACGGYKKPPRSSEASPRQEDTVAGLLRFLTVSHVTNLPLSEPAHDRDGVQDHENHLHRGKRAVTRQKSIDKPQECGKEEDNERIAHELRE